ncbi:MAG: SDR family NAD(P)-dependent oxidoreductase, partial [Dehalococcoidia bacterium]
ALELAKRGMAVACVARTLHEGDHTLSGSLDATVAEIEAAGGRGLAIAANIADEAECRRVVAETVENLGPVDLLVNNAAFAWFGPVAQVSAGRFKRVLDVNLTAPLMLSQAVLPSMVERAGGAIINVSSGAARGPGRGPYDGDTAGIGGATIYGVSKAALDRLSQGMAEEVFPHGITVASLGPSRVVMTPGTALHGYSTDDTEPETFMARAVALIAGGTPAQWSGRILYSQRVLEECGELGQAVGPREAYLPRIGD